MHALPDSDPRNWRNQALLHLKYCPHGKQDFVHWHRHYISNFEMICGALTGHPEFSLPYWNWSANNGRVPNALYDLPGLNVESWKDASNASDANWNSGLAVTTDGTRGLLKGIGLQDDPRLAKPFTEATIASIRRETAFSAFTNRLESEPHNNAHVIAGGNNGHMGDGLSSLDPLFWMHHCGIDRVWAQWQAAGNTTPGLTRDYVNQFVGRDGKPVKASSATALSTTALGFTYDVLASASTANQQLPVLSTSAFALIGTADGLLQIKPKVETRAKFVVPGVFKAMSSRRTFWSLEVGPKANKEQEPSRILARLSGVMPPKTRVPMIVNVFVNCPYLSPETASTDQHFAGSFSFFGMYGDGHQHSEYLVDLTEPLAALRRNGKAIDEIHVQFMAVAVNPQSDLVAPFAVGKVELVSG
jgi:tyrosinase